MGRILLTKDGRGPSIPEGENLSLADMARGVLGHLAHLLSLWTGRLSYRGEK